MKFTNEYYLKEAPIKKSFIHLTIPMLIGLSIGTVYNVINMYFVGLLHNVDMLTALTLILPIFIILMALGNMVGVGSGTYITRLIAKDKDTLSKKIANNALYSSLILGGIVAILGIIFIDPILSLLGVASNLILLIKPYTLLYFILSFSIILNFTFEQIVRGTGATRESMYGMAISVIINLIFDPILIIFCNLGLIGVVISLALANLVSAFYYIYYLSKKEVHLKDFYKTSPILSLKDFLEIYKIGISELIQMSFMLITTLLLNNYFMEYGALATASIGIALRIVQIPEFLSMGVFLGLLPLLTYNFSIKNFKRFKEGFFVGVKFISIFSISCLVLGYLFRNEILNLFSKNPEILKIGGYIFTVLLISQVFNGLTGLFIGAFQGAGLGFPTAVISIIQGTLAIPLIILGHFYLGLNGVIWATPITEIIAFLFSLLFFIIFFKNKLMD